MSKGITLKTYNVNKIDISKFDNLSEKKQQQVYRIAQKLFERNYSFIEDVVIYSKKNAANKRALVSIFGEKWVELITDAYWEDSNKDFLEDLGLPPAQRIEKLEDRLGSQEKLSAQGLGA